MAAGCFPVAGDLESVREWIADGENGFLCNPNDPNQLAACIVSALLDPNLRGRAAEINRRFVRERAEYRRVMENAEHLYDEVLSAAAPGKKMRI